LADAEARREEDVRESMVSLSVLSSSRATSHRPVRISEANLPQYAELLRSLSDMEGVNTNVKGPTTVRRAEQHDGLHVDANDPTTT